MIDVSHKWNITITPLVIGFFLSFILTLVAFLVPAGQFLSYQAGAITLMVVATLQALGQMVFFLHLGIESRPRWKLMMFLFMVFIMLVIVCGSLWIMKNLEYNLMLPMEH